MIYRIIIRSGQMKTINYFSRWLNKRNHTKRLLLSSRKITKRNKIQNNELYYMHDKKKVIH